jgi:hypothetical protein
MSRATLIYGIALIIFLAAMAFNEFNDRQFQARAELKARAKEPIDRCESSGGSWVHDREPGGGWRGRCSFEEW